MSAPEPPGSGPGDPARRAYLAGILDGEGCIRIERSLRPKARNYRYDPWVQVTNTNLHLLGVLQDQFGGRIYRTNKHGNRKPAYQLVWRGRDEVLVVLSSARPYLLVKAEQADLVSDLIRHTRDNPRTPFKEADPEVITYRDRLYERVTALNKRGRPLEE